MIFVGIDWAESSHEICIVEETGAVLAKAKVPNDIQGVGRLHAMVAEHAQEPSEVLVGIETDRGLLVGSLVQAGYRVYAINPLAASRYRDRHSVSRAKSDPGDAKVLADIVRTDRRNHREVAGDSELAETIKVLARAHQNLIWSRQRQVSALRSTLLEFYPGALRAFRSTELATVEACSVLAMAPTPTWARRGSRLRACVARSPLRGASATSTGVRSISWMRSRAPSCRLRRCSRRPTAMWWAPWRW